MVEAIRQLPAPFAYAPEQIIRLPIQPPMAYTNWTEGDGNCQFRAFAMALDGGLTSHQEIRRRVVAGLREPEYSEHYVDRFAGPDDYQRYVSRMERDGEWGDDIALNMMGRLWRVNVAVLRPNGGGGFNWNKIYEEGEERFYLCLYFANNNHYENLILINEAD